MDYSLDLAVRLQQKRIFRGCGTAPKVCRSATGSKQPSYFDELSMTGETHEEVVEITIDVTLSLSKRYRKQVAFMLR
jgi:hypothetical protein